MALGILSLRPSTPLSLSLSVSLSSLPSPYIGPASICTTFIWTNMANKKLACHCVTWGSSRSRAQRSAPDSAFAFALQLLLLLLLLVCLPGWHYPFNPLWLVTCAAVASPATRSLPQYVTWHIIYARQPQLMANRCATAGCVGKLSNRHSCCCCCCFSSCCCCFSRCCCCCCLLAEPPVCAQLELVPQLRCQSALIIQIALTLLPLPHLPHLPHLTCLVLCVCSI